MNIDYSKINQIDAKAVFAFANLQSDQVAQLLFSCVVDGHNGIYCGQAFAENVLSRSSHSADKETVSALLAGPDSEDYWESVDLVQSAQINSETTGRTHAIHVGESGDWFLYDSDKLNLWGLLTGKDFWELYT